MHLTITPVRPEGLWKCSMLP